MYEVIWFERSPWSPRADSLVEKGCSFASEAEANGFADRLASRSGVSKTIPPVVSEVEPWVTVGR